MTTDTSDTIVSMNVGGTILQTDVSTLQRFPTSKLCRMVELHRNEASDSKALFIDRSPKYFKVVLEIFRTGDIHMSPNLCWYRTKEEVEFWELEAHAQFPSCCTQRVLEIEERESLEKYLEKQLDEYCAPNLSGKCFKRKPDNGCLSRINKVWLFLEDPDSSIGAKIWGLFFLFVVLLSVFVQVGMTHPKFRYDTENPRWNITGQRNSKIVMFATTKMYAAIWYLELLCLAVFVSELLVRFLFCPDKLVFFRSLFNIIDIVCLVPMIIFVVLEYNVGSGNKERFLYVAYVLSALGIFRILRLFKFLRHILCMRILLLALKASMREIALFLMLLMIGMLVFSNLIYFAEFYIEGQFETIPIGFWWAVVTMTTVGYGDTHPQSAWGYVVGSACAICGMLLIGIPIPAVANNFSLLYTMARRKELMNNRLESETKLELSSAGKARCNLAHNDSSCSERPVGRMSPRSPNSVIPTSVG